MYSKYNNYFRDQIQQYTRQLAKDTSANLKELNVVPTGLSQTEQRQFKMQRERLTDEFTTALNAFQATQRSAAQKVKQQMERNRAMIEGDPYLPGILYTDFILHFTLNYILDIIERFRSAVN